MQKLILNQKKFEEVLSKHKRLLASLKSWDVTTKKGQEANSGKFRMLEKTGKELTLAYSRFKCERRSCGSTEKLQFHHMIMRPIKEFTDFYRYETQRKYWANILVLCDKCHYEIHTSINQFPKQKAETSLFIQKELINHVKKKYFEEEK